MSVKERIRQRLNCHKLVENNPCAAMIPIEETYAELHCMCSEANIHETNDGLFQIINLKETYFIG